MAIYKREKRCIYFSTTCKTIRSHFIRYIPKTCNVFKKVTSLPLAILISFSMIFYFQACQPNVNGEGIAVMNQNDTTPLLPPDTELIRDSSNGTIRVLKGVGLSKPLMEDEDYRNAISNRLPGETAITFIDAYRSVFKLQNPRSELTVSTVDTDTLKMTHIRLKQQYNGVEVWPADINVHLNESGHVYLVQGRYTPTPSNLKEDPHLNESDALMMVANDAGIEMDQLNKYRTKLIVYCGLTETPVLAYRVYAEVSISRAWIYVVDSQTGMILDKISAVQSQSAD